MFLLRNFKLNRWKRLSLAKRQSVLQKLENKMAKRVGRPALPISIITNPTWYCFGMFEFKDGKQILHINIQLISKINLRFQAMATVLHEGRHATQHYIITHDPAWFQFKSKRWKKNMNNYISSVEDENLYQVQEVERDAQQFVIKKLKNWKYKFENENDYIITYNAIKKQYENNINIAKLKYGKFYKFKINNAIKKQKNKTKMQ